MVRVTAKAGRRREDVGREGEWQEVSRGRRRRRKTGCGLVRREGLG